MNNNNNTNIVNNTTSNYTNNYNFDIKFIDTAGICQLYNYLSTVALFGSFGYILACLIDRIFKINII